MVLVHSRLVLLPVAFWSVAATAVGAAAASSSSSRKYEIPTLPWPAPLPPDWVSVKAVGGAKADGQTDDTKAIQATVDLFTT